MATNTDVCCWYDQMLSTVNEMDAFLSIQNIILAGVWRKSKYFRCGLLK